MKRGAVGSKQKLTLNEVLSPESLFEGNYVSFRT